MPFESIVNQSNNSASSSLVPFTKSSSSSLRQKRRSMTQGCDQRDQQTPNRNLQTLSQQQNGFKVKSSFKPSMALLFILTFLIAVSFMNFASANSWDKPWGSTYQSESKRKAEGGEMQLETLLSEGEENCMRKRCVHSDQCCPGSVCVDLESSVLGTCLPIYGMSEGESCNTDDDCESGLRCLDANLYQYKAAAAAAAASAAANQQSIDQQSSSLLSSSPLFAVQKPAGLKTCQPPGRDMKKKQYNDECYTSDECDSSRGLCCQLIRRHRMAPRKLCYYFSDPKACIGAVDVSHAKPIHVAPNAFFKARIG